MDNFIDYKKIMHSASLGAIRSILTDVSKQGLPGNHHLYITFDMANEEVNISKSLRTKYPEEMTIVIQNWYDGLTVNESSFAITLNFGNVLESMIIPFSAIKSFVDPSVEFGLSFDTKVNSVIKPINEDEFFDLKNQNSVKSSREPTLDVKKSGDIVNLENFRKS